MRKYKHLFFDLDNTLWDFRKNSYFALKISYLKYKDIIGEEDFDKFYAVYLRHNDRLWKGYRNGEVSKENLILKRFGDTFQELRIAGIDAAEFNAAYLEEMPNQPCLVEGASDILEYLHKKYSLYIITNGFREVQSKKLENAGIKDFFKKIFISEIIKIHKPDPEIFIYAVQSVNARKSESLMIGDDPDVDIIGACRAGIDQVYYSHDNQFGNSICEEENNRTRTFRINHLSQLCDFL